MEEKFKIVLYYKYVNIENPELFRTQQFSLCKKLNLKGRIIIAKEGINGTLEGFEKDIDAYCAGLASDPRFADVHFKFSEGTGNAFPKLSVKTRNEIVSSHLREKDINPNVVRGKYLQAEELHEWFTSDKEFYIVDMRNDFEQEVGRFENSILSGMANFRDLIKTLKNVEHLRNKTVLTVCTGGVRCEKASGFLVENGFTDVYQLHGGIVSYMEKYPNQHFLGKLYVFDSRIIMGFNTDDEKHVVIGKCAKCRKPSETYINCSYDECHKHFICCESCAPEGKAFCSNWCALKCTKLFQKVLRFF